MAMASTRQLTDLIPLQLETDLKQHEIQLALSSIFTFRQTHKHETSLQNLVTLLMTSIQMQTKYII